MEFSNHFGFLFALSQLFFGASLHQQIIIIIYQECIYENYNQNINHYTIIQLSKMQQLNTIHEGKENQREQLERKQGKVERKLLQISPLKETSLNFDIQDLPTLKLKIAKSSQELEEGFQQNGARITSLNNNMANLLSKISQLNETMEPVKKQEEAENITAIEPVLIRAVEGKKDLDAKLAVSVILQPQQCFQNIQQKQSPQNNLSMKLFQTGKTLGFGKFGEVLQCKNLSTGTLYALKKIFKSTIREYQMQNQLLAELEALKRLSHKHIVQGYVSYTDQFHIFILMELAAGKNLAKKVPLSEEQTKNIIRQTLQAVKYMHSQNITHRDIKLQNIIENDGEVKICDFGWSAIDQREMNIICGTLEYICPEMVLNQPYTCLVDMWSVGILTYQLLFGITPFKASSKTEIFRRVQKGEVNYPQGNSASQSVIDFIQKLLKPEKERISAEEALQHQFLSIKTQINKKNEPQFSDLEQFNKLQFINLHKI